jgi:hypothetical protein
MSLDKLPGPNERKQKKLVEDPGGVYDEVMLKRVEKLEQDIVDIKTDLAVVKATHATRADVAEAKLGVIVWVVSAVLLAQLFPTLLKIYFPH